jgi:hypothetical protein
MYTVTLILALAISVQGTTVVETPCTQNCEAFC